MSGPLVDHNVVSRDTQECHPVFPLGANISISANSGPLTPWKESYDQPRQHTKKQRHYFVNKGPSHQGYGFFQWSCMDVRVGL